MFFKISVTFEQIKILMFCFQILIAETFLFNIYYGFLGVIFQNSSITRQNCQNL